MRTLAAIVCLFLAGCHALPSVRLPGKGQLPEVKVQGVKDAGKPVVVDSSGEESRIELPAGSTITITRTEAQPATDTAPAKPAVEVRAITVASDAAMIEKAQRVSANSGTVDTSVAKHRIDTEDRAKLLWVAVACGIAGIAAKLLMPSWPTAPTACFAAAALAFGAWKVSQLPEWLWAVVIGGFVIYAIGWWNRDRNGDGIPDRLQKAHT